MPGAIGKANARTGGSYGKTQQAAAEAVQFTPTEETAPQTAQTVQPAEEQSKARRAARQFVADPFPFKTVNVAGTRSTSSTAARPASFKSGSAMAGRTTSL